MEGLNNGCLQQLLIASVIAGLSMSRCAYETGQRHEREKLNTQIRKSEAGLSRCLESLGQKKCQKTYRWNPETEKMDRIPQPGCID